MRAEVSRKPLDIERRIGTEKPEWLKQMETVLEVLNEGVIVVLEQSTALGNAPRIS
jgi:hypothetical protein